MENHLSPESTAGSDRRQVTQKRIPTVVRTLLILTLMSGALGLALPSPAHAHDLGDGVPYHLIRPYPDCQSYIPGFSQRMVSARFPTEFRGFGNYWEQDRWSPDLQRWYPGYGWMTVDSSAPFTPFWTNSRGLHDLRMHSRAHNFYPSQPGYYRIKHWLDWTATDFYHKEYTNHCYVS